MAVKKGDDIGNDNVNDKDNDDGVAITITWQ